VQAPARLATLTETTCTDGFAGPYPCRDVDLLSYLSHAEMGGGSGNDIWGWTDPETGREYALVGESTGTAFVDISTPSQPLYLGALPTHTAPSAWRASRSSPITPSSSAKRSTTACRSST
jgi:choice-of-anchor B domain-containing protein